MIIAKVIIPNIIATFFMFFLNSGLIFIIILIFNFYNFNSAHSAVSAMAFTLGDTAFPIYCSNINYTPCFPSI